MTLTEAIRAVYAQVEAPHWAAANLDALADVLRDLSWRAEGLVTIELPDVTDPADAARFVTVLRRATEETADTRRPVHLVL